MDDSVYKCYLQLGLGNSVNSPTFIIYLYYYNNYILIIYVILQLIDVESNYYTGFRVWGLVEAILQK